MTPTTPGAALVRSVALLAAPSVALVLVLLLFSGGAGAQTLRLDQLTHAPLGPRALYLQESHGALSLQQAIAALQRGEFRRDDRLVASFGIGARPVWIHLDLDNPGGQAMNLRLEVGTSWIDHLDVTLVQSGRVLSSWQSGDEAGALEGAGAVVPGLGFVFPLAVPPGHADLFIRTAAIEALILPLRLQSPASAEADDRKLHYGYGLLYGFLSALIAYQLMLFVGLRKRSHLLYALYLLSFIAANLSYTGHGYAWWWSDQVVVERFAVLVTMVVFGVSGLLFAANFLALKQEAPRMWRCLMGLLLLVGVMLGAFVAFDLRLALAWLAFGFLLVFSVIMLLLGLWALRRPNQVGPYFLAATLFGVAGASVTGLAVWGWLPLNAATWHGAEWGILIEATLLALALASQMREYQEARHQAEQLAYTDALTGLPNRRGFFGTAPEVWAAARHDALPLTVVMLDLDHFKAVNDEHGHAAGDLVLAGVAKLLRQTCRGRDLPARWGGEEFVLLLPHTDLEQARALAERLRLSIEATSFMIGTHRLALTASLGVAELHGESSLDDLIAEADECLYRAKNEGRNRVGRLAR